MSSPDEQSYRSDKVVKRTGTIGKDPSSPSKIGSSPHPDPSLPVSTIYDPKPSSGLTLGGLLAANHNHNNHRGGISNRAMASAHENWMPKRYIFAILCILSVVALSGSLAFVLSLGHSTQFKSLADGSSVITGRLPTSIYGSSHELDVRDAAWTNEILRSRRQQQDQHEQVEQQQVRRTEDQVVTDEIVVARHQQHDQPEQVEQQQLRRTEDQVVTCDPRFAALRVYMYDLPSEFHFGILDKFEPDDLNVWPRNLSILPRYPGGLYQQHSPEYWMTADILTSNTPGRKHECTAVRVQTPEEADVIFVPFFASLSYNKYTKMERKDGQDINEDLQEKLVKYLRKQKPWQESGGSDHVIVIHHPNSLHKVRDTLRSAMYVVCDFGRYSEETANMRKDIVAPYKHVMPVFKDDNSTFDTRTTLLFFQGAIFRKEGGVIRQQLFELLQNEEGVNFVPGNTQSSGIKSATLGMRNSKFCLHLAGDTPSSNRLFDAVASHCVPVVISDEIELPYEDALDYSEFCLFIRTADALKKGFVIKLLRAINKEEWTRMWYRLQEVIIHFEYQHPTEPNDAVNMMWKAIARRAPTVTYNINKGKRYARSGWPQPSLRRLNMESSLSGTELIQ
ncbi:unnamed protein product [Calypogeia fissa]